jgi:hypothetical protein
MHTVLFCRSQLGINLKLSLQLETLLHCYLKIGDKIKVKGSVVVLLILASEIRIDSNVIFS